MERLTKRLTKKNSLDKFYCFKTYTSYTDCYNNEANKLGQLEDIEEKLGIDLITLFKIIKKGVYYHSAFGIYHTKDLNCDVVLSKDRLKILSYEGNRFLSLSFENYKKTWSLRKKDLDLIEKEKEKK